MTKEKNNNNNKAQNNNKTVRSENQESFDDALDIKLSGIVLVEASAQSTVEKTGNTL